ncbi:ArnT family glycosyltransferase [Mucilaginibacter terrae]|uniref:ArnT family glycosyltransferase n=1 Tax=Mucilaginibacter terrae TaxID=1955052 RepID=UPI00363854DF
MLLAPLNKATSNKYILYFLIGWTVLNVLQAATLGVHADEAYYWVYSRFLDWGYYDHPPMVALFIRIGDSLITNELGLRLLTVITSTLSVYLLWLIARKYEADARWFMLLLAGILALHIYGFTTTPDAPLLFFTILFYYVYQQYLQKDSWLLALLLAVVVTLLLYSKYHSILLIFFTLLANPGMFKRLSFYVIPVIAVVLYLPHILWQVEHNYPSASYHLFERSAESYDFARTYMFVPLQLLIAGPLISWFLFYYAFGKSVNDDFTRCLTFNGIGIFIFFWLITIKGNVQPHWTLIGLVPLLLLTLIRFKQSGFQPLWFYRLAFINAGLIVLFRILLVAGIPAVKNWEPVKNYFHYDEWTRQIKQKVGDNYVIMPVGFQSASKYNYYTRSLKGFAYDVFDYRRTQYDIWPIEDSMQNKRAFYMAPFPLHGLKTDSIKTITDNWYGIWVNKVRSYQKIDIKTDSSKITAKPGQTIKLKLEIYNPYSKTVNFSNTTVPNEVALRACFYHHNEQPQIQKAGESFNHIRILPHQKASYTFTFTAPVKKGRYDLVFSIRTTPFPGGRNSRAIKFTVQ